MIELSVDELSLASKILLSRLSRPSTLDIAIVIPNAITREMKLDNHIAKFVGGFHLGHNDNICFSLICHSKEDDVIDHVFVYYLNEEYTQIHPLDISILRPFVPNIGRPGSIVKKGVINVVTSSSPDTYLSIMIEAIDATIGEDLVRNFVSARRVDMTSQDLSIGRNPSCRLDHCDGKPKPDILSRMKAVAEEFGIRLALGDHPSQLHSPEMALIKTLGHIVGCIHHNNTVNYLVVHKNQFRDEEHYQDVCKMVDSWYPTGSNLKHVVTRFCPNSFIRCDDEMVMMAWRLMLWMRPHIMLMIQENEIHYLLGNYEKLNFHLNWLRNQQARSNIVTLPVSRQLSSQRSQVMPQSDCIISSQLGHADLIVPHDSSQRRQRSLDWAHDLSTAKELSIRRKRIGESIIPPVHDMSPFMDLHQTYLEHLPSYHNGIKLMGRIWDRYLHTIVFPITGRPLERADISTSGAHFWICPLIDDILDDYLVIVDANKNEWILLNPDNEAYKNPRHFETIAKPHVFSIYPELENFNGRAVLMTSVTQKHCSRVHLLMSLYVISRLFHYCRALPQKIIYGDWELRKYAQNICTELQTVNADHNSQRGLIDSRGYYILGAFQSLSSPLVADNAVVPKDQCMFCKKRYARNLGRHMAAEHGEQAALANRSRLQFD